MKNMKRYILLLCTLCLGLVSCVKENMAGVDADGLTTFKAVHADVSTKTVLDGLTPMWTADDKISIYDGVNNEFGNALTAPAATVEFKGKLGGNEKTYLAASPYNADLMFAMESKGVYGLMLPYEQQAVENGCDPSALLSVAYTDNYQLKFKNVCSLIKFTIASDGVTSVKVVANGGESLSGQFNVTYSEDPKTTPSQGRKSEVVLKGEFKKGSTYYISTMVASLGSGLEVILNESVTSLAYASPVALERSGLVNLGSLSLNPGESELPDNPGAGDEPEEGMVYFMPSSDWLSDGAHIAAYLWKDGTEDNVWVGLEADSVEGVFKCEVPEGYTNIIFVRIKAGAENNWDNKLAQTADLTVPAGEEVCFVPTGKDAEGKVTGTWTTYPPTGVTPDPGTGPGEGVETVSTIYLRPNSNWLEANARFAAYFFNASGDTWVSMTADTEDKVYKCDVPEGYASVIFVRMNPDSSVNSWDDKWGQTADLNVPAAGSDNICYVIAAGTWGEDGYWTTYPPVVTDPDPTPDPTPDPNPGTGEEGQVIYLNAGGSGLWDQAGAWFEAWSWGTGEGSWYKMTSAGSGLYKCTVPEGNNNIIFVRRGPDMVSGWDVDVHYWNKTDDLVIPAGKNCYTITGWGGSDGKWSTL